MSNRRKIFKDNLPDQSSSSQPQQHVHRRSKIWLTQQHSLRKPRMVKNNFILGGRRGRGRGRGGGGPSRSSSSLSPTAIPSTTTKSATSSSSPTSSSVSSSSQFSTISPPKTSSTRKISNLYYSVEEILGRREHQGKVEYLLKWKGYPEHCNSWETAVNLTQDLLIEFDLSSPAMEMLSKEPKEIVLMKDTPSKILDIRKTKDESLEYLVQWKSDPELDWIAGNIMKQAFPNLVIEFYERISKMID